MAAALKTEVTPLQEELKVRQAALMTAEQAVQQAQQVVENRRQQIRPQTPAVTSQLIERCKLIFGWMHSGDRLSGQASKRTPPDIQVAAPKSAGLFESVGGQ